MIRLHNPEKTDKVLNLCAGSGTLLIERCQLLYPKPGLGIEIDPETVELANKNIKASLIPKKYKIIQGDIFALPDLITSERYNSFIIDLPCGMNRPLALNL